MRNLRKMLYLLAATILLSALIVPPVSVNAAVKINATKKTIYVGTNYTLKVTGTTKYIMWKSSNKKVAKVSSKGVVTGIAEGTATITATVGSGSNNKKFTCKVTVKPRLSTNNTNIICLLDEYEEIDIDFVKPKKNEYLTYIINDDGVADFEWADDDENHILRIVPQEVGATSISIHTATGESLRDFKINDEKLLINVTVLRDSKWIASSDLSAIGIHDFITRTYFIINGEIPAEIDTVLTADDGVKYKYDGKHVYYDIETLKELGIMK